MVDTLGQEYAAIWKVIKKATKKDKNARYPNVVSMKGAILEATIIDNEVTGTIKNGNTNKTKEQVITPKEVVGCMDPKAINYNPKANMEGTCQYPGPPRPLRWILISGCVILIGVIGFFLFRDGDSFNQETLTGYVKAGEYQEALDYLDDYPDQKANRQDDITTIEELLQISKL